MTKSVEHCLAYADSLPGCTEVQEVIKTLAAAVPRWIPITDENLPPMGESVLIGWADGGYDLAYRYTFPKKSGKWEWAGVCEHHAQPSHWMRPLIRPAIPVGEKAA